MTLFAIRALLCRVPGIAWVILFAIAFLSAAGYGLYRHGEREGAVEVRRAAGRDSIAQQQVVVTRAARKSDSVITVARKAVGVSGSGRARTRAVLEAAKDSTLRTVFEAVSEQLAHDSTTIAVQTAAIDTLVAERGSRIQLATIQEHQMVFKPPGDGVSMVDVVKDVGIVVLVIEAVRLVLQLLGR